MNRRRSALYAVAALAATLVTCVPTAVPSFAAPDEPATVSSPLRGARTSAQLIHSAAAVNRFDEAQELRYLVDAFTAPDRLPSTLRGTTPPKSGTTLLAELHDRIGRLPDGPLRTELAPRVGLSATRGGRTMTVPALPDGRGACHTAVEPMSYTVQTPHFFVEHEGVFPPGLTLADYTTALERAYDVHVKLFGFAAPPLTAVPPPGGKYHVRIQDIGPDLYGYVAAIGTYAGNVGNNPSTSWNDGDAFASCMVLSATAFEKYDWARFSARDYLDDTVQHEFHHMVQYGMGLVFAPTPTGPYTRAIDANAVEGMAMWSEAESPYSRDTSNQWVWPILADSMGDPGEWDHYSYFTVWRAFTEPYGVGVPGGGEQLVQDYYEGLSQNKWRQLDGLDAVLRARGRTLPDAFHDQAISSLFSAACGGQYRRPFCWDDGAAYTTDGYRDIDYPIDLDLGEPRVVALPDDYSRQWFTLPAGRQLEVRVTGATDGGRVRVSVACNTGKSIVVRTLGTDLVGKQAATLGVGNQPCATPWVLVLTNLAQSSPDPVTSPLRVVHLHVQEKHDSVTATPTGRYYSHSADISADGSRVAFVTSGTLVAEDTNTIADVYVRDTATGVIRLVSADATGRAAGDSWQPSISDDGSRVAFMSYSPELRGAGGYFTSEIYVRHLISATTTKITPSSPADLPNLFPAISGDGRFVAFGSTEIPDGDASEPAPGGGAYIRDTAAAGPITRLDRRSPDAIFTETIGIALDYDGDTAVMQTNASHTTDDGNGVHDVYLIRRGAQPELVSRGLSGLAGDDASSDPSIDGAGEVIAFTSRARDMGVANSIRQADVFTWAATEGIRLVSAPASGGRTSRESLNGQVSADGRSVAFTSFVQLVADDADGGLGDVYLHDRADRSLRVVSLDAAGGHIWQYAELESVSGNGSLVAFRTVWQLVPKDTSWNDVDVYVRDVVSGSVTLLG